MKQRIDHTFNLVSDLHTTRGFPHGDVNVTIVQRDENPVVFAIYLRITGEAGELVRKETITVGMDQLIHNEEGRRK